MKNLSLLVVLAVGCGDDARAPDAAATPPTFTARIRGALAAPTLDDAKTYHDQVAAGGKAGANANGDFAHHVGLGTTYFGTPENQFLAIDQWHSLDGAQRQYADPSFQAALAPLFVGAPDVALFERHDDWAGWGDMGAGIGAPRWFVVIQGRLAKPDLEANHTAHDAAATGGEAQARAAGDLAHLPHLAVGDDRTFFNIDIWASEQGMLATFNDPTFAASVASLFEAPPEIRIYRSTDWYQWYEP